MACDLYFFEHFILCFAGQKRADAKAEVAAEAETGTDTETETGITTETGIGTGRDGIAQGPGRTPETTIATEIEMEIVEKEETNLSAGLSAHLVPRKTKTKTKTLSAGKTNTWTAHHLRSLLSVTYTTAKSPVSCSLDALFSWRD